MLQSVPLIDDYVVQLLRPLLQHHFQLYRALFVSSLRNYCRSLRFQSLPPAVVAEERAGPWLERLQLYGDRGRDGHAAGRPQCGDHVCNQQSEDITSDLYLRKVIMSPLQCLGGSRSNVLWASFPFESTFRHLGYSFTFYGLLSAWKETGS